MANKNVRFQLRGANTNISNTDVLLRGEPGYKDGYFKIGDGTTPWAGLILKTMGMEIGENNTTRSIRSLLVGDGNELYATQTIGGTNVLITGYNNTVVASGSAVFGASNVVGDKTNQDNRVDHTIVNGFENIVLNTERGCFVSGTNNEVKNTSGCLVSGRDNILNGFVSVNLLGEQLKASANYQTVVGVGNAEDSGAIFIVGKGTKASPKNVFTVSTTGQVTTASHIRAGGWIYMNPSTAIQGYNFYKEAKQDLTSISAKALMRKDEIQALINQQVSTLYKPQGSCTFAQLITKTRNDSTVGYVYNVTDAFTTTDAFIEGAGIKVQAGTNVVIVKNTNDSKFYFDLLSIGVDLSGYYTKEQVDNAITSHTPNLSNYYTKNDTYSKTEINTSLSNYYTKSQVDSAIESHVPQINLTNYYTKTEANSTFINKTEGIDDIVTAVGDKVTTKVESNVRKSFYPVPKTEIEYEKVVSGVTTTVSKGTTSYDLVTLGPTNELYNNTYSCRNRTKNGVVIGYGCIANSWSEDTSKYILWGNTLTYATINSVWPGYTDYNNLYRACIVGEDLIINDATAEDIKNKFEELGTYSAGTTLISVLKNGTTDKYVWRRTTSLAGKYGDIGGLSIGTNALSHRGTAIGYNVSTGYYGVAIGIRCGNGSTVGLSRTQYYNGQDDFGTDSNFGRSYSYRYMIGDNLNFEKDKDNNVNTNKFTHFVLIGSKLKATRTGQIAIGLNYTPNADSVISFGYNTALFDITSSGILTLPQKPTTREEAFSNSEVMTYADIKKILQTEYGLNPIE